MTGLSVQAIAGRAAASVSLAGLARDVGWGIGSRRMEGLGNPSREPVACPEGCKRLRHVMRVLDLQAMRGARKDESFDVGKHL